ncbi:hypothetical protein D6833_13425 [Candidatus Parcubacteria bacterium]|nr:MAG: hypothetical protein D6833_13425 [Candidatus Parcubacteria bacterium]
MSDVTGEKVLDMESRSNAYVSRATDPAITPQPYSSPADFSAQYPTPLDPTEVINMCEEVTLLSAIPEQRTGLKQYTWREMTSLAFTSGSSYIAFADGECPEEYTHDGTNYTVTLKNIGAKKTLSESDIMHSAAVAAAAWNGINTLVAPAAAGQGVPGGNDLGTFMREHVANVKEKDIRFAMTLVLNGEDALLVNGDSNSNSLEFDGFENWATNMSVSFHTNSDPSGTFSAASFDRFLSEGCAKPTHIFGHPQAVQEMLSGYFQLGYSGSQVVNFADGGRIVPGFNFAGVVNTGVGALKVVADNNFRRTDLGGSSFQADLWAMRMTHNGEPMVFRLTQIPLSLKDLAPGCTAVSFEVYKKTALIIKNACMHGKYTASYTGRIASTCSVIG